MLDRFKKVASAPVLVVKHVGRHRGTYFMGSIALVLLVGSVRNSNGFNKFMIEKGIDPNEFWLAPEDYAELMAEMGAS